MTSIRKSYTEISKLRKLLSVSLSICTIKKVNNVLRIEINIRYITFPIFLSVGFVKPLDFKLLMDLHIFRCADYDWSILGLSA